MEFRPRLRPLFAAMLALLALSGCGGAGTNNVFITGFAFSLVPPIPAGTSTTITATVKDPTMLKSSAWSADGGTLSNSTGVTVTWTAPAMLNVAATFTVKLKATQTNGLSDTQSVKIAVQPSSSNLTGARITGITSSETNVKPGDIVTATVAVVSNADVVDAPTWTATIGSMDASGAFVTKQGYTVQWQVPANFTSGQTATLNVAVVGKNGDIHTGQLTLTSIAANSAFITGFTVTPSASVAAGGTVSITATVKDPTAIKSTSWSTNGGTLSTTTGLSVQWTAPFTVVSPAPFAITLKATQSDGSIDTQMVNVFVQPSQSNLTGARITGITSSETTVRPGDVVTATVAVISNADVVDAPTWTATIGNTDASASFITQKGYTVQWQVPANFAAGQIATLNVSVVGKNADIHTDQLTLFGSTVVTPPLITKVTATPASVTGGSSIALQVTPADPTNVSTITWSADGGTLTSTQGDTNSWVAPVVPNLTVFIITATLTNKSGQTSSSSVQVVSHP